MVEIGFCILNNLKILDMCGNTKEKTASTMAIINNFTTVTSNDKSKEKKNHVREKSL